MLVFIAVGIGAYLGHRKWGGARGAIIGGLIALGIYYLITFAIVFIIMLGSSQVEEILIEVGDSV